MATGSRQWLSGKEAASGGPRAEAQRARRRFRLGHGVGRVRPKRSMAKQDRGRGRDRPRYRMEAGWGIRTRETGYRNRIIAVLTQLGSEV